MQLVAKCYELRNAQASRLPQSRIPHSVRVYVMGDVHTNTVEGFWSLPIHSLKKDRNAHLVVSIIAALIVHGVLDMQIADAAIGLGAFPWDFANEIDELRGQDNEQYIEHGGQRMFDTPHVQGYNSTRIDRSSRYRLPLVVRRQIPAAAFIGGRSVFL